MSRTDRKVDTYKTGFWRGQPQNHLDTTHSVEPDRAWQGSARQLSLNAQAGPSLCCIQTDVHVCPIVSSPLQRLQRAHCIHNSGLAATPLCNMISCPTHRNLSVTKSIFVPTTCIRAAGSIRMRTPCSSTTSSNLPF